MELAEGDIDELIEYWTLLDEDRALLIGKRGASALGFVLLLKHYSHVGRFPRGRSDLSDAVIESVARQVGVDASDLGFYEWSGRTIEYHRNQIRASRVSGCDDQRPGEVHSVADKQRRPRRAAAGAGSRRAAGAVPGGADRATDGRSGAAHGAVCAADS